MASDDVDAKMAAMFTGNYIDATDLKDVGECTVTIDSVTPPREEKDAAGKVIDKAVLRFKDRKKALILGKCNAKIIALIHGKKPSQWVGKSITLTVRYLKEAFGQSNVPVIRVKADESTPMPFGMRKHYGSDRPFARRD